MGRGEARHPLVYTVERLLFRGSPRESPDKKYNTYTRRAGGNTQALNYRHIRQVIILRKRGAWTRRGKMLRNSASREGRLAPSLSFFGGATRVPPPERRDPMKTLHRDTGRISRKEL